MALNVGDLDGNRTWWPGRWDRHRAELSVRSHPRLTQSFPPPIGFEVTVRELAHPFDHEALSTAVTVVRSRGFLNYFGTQRVGMPLAGRSAAKQASATAATTETTTSAGDGVEGG